MEKPAEDDRDRDSGGDGAGTTVALRNGATLLSHDADMDRLARVVKITLDSASLRAPQ